MEIYLVQLNLLIDRKFSTPVDIPRVCENRPAPGLLLRKCNTYSALKTIQNNCALANASRGYLVVEGYVGPRYCAYRLRHQQSPEAGFEYSDMIDPWHLRAQDLNEDMLRRLREMHIEDLETPGEVYLGYGLHNSLLTKTRLGEIDDVSKKDRS
ncbi:unnamed protein product [Pieris macdunnoughi]|uniref:Uncharacterized protein n=1 Tax=Pieris macdunnoughi TaxID=345717 RepID=A0A821RHH5_9NEOP|nr:unnamed protein product [Pieris macdunnoughi]